MTVTDDIAGTIPTFLMLGLATNLARGIKVPKSKGRAFNASFKSGHHAHKH